MASYWARFAPLIFDTRLSTLIQSGAYLSISYSSYLTAPYTLVYFYPFSHNFALVLFTLIFLWVYVLLRN